ncbi:MAG: helicase-related protein, partial [Patescibacteria group bacterium]
VVELIEAGGSTVLRITFDDAVVAQIAELHAITFNKVATLERTIIFPAKHYLIDEPRKHQAIKAIRAELQERLPQLGDLERHRLEKRTRYDLEMIEQLGSCKGIENYSRHFDGRAAGQPPFTLLDYFNQKGEWLMFIDESHVSVPQVGGMYEGDRSRKQSLIDHGFRLPSAYDNRPLKFYEFEKYLKHVVYVSATPSEYEIRLSGQVVEQIIRPTGLVDPEIEVRPAANQVLDVQREIGKTTAAGGRVLVTTLTKRLAEDLTSYLVEQGIKARYLHSEIKTMERTKLIQDLRLGKFDVLVGINLLREGLDLPEVSLVAILDADKEGFLRNERSLIQTIGRAARNIDGHVIMYADKITGSIKGAIEETDRRRKRQREYNETHGITPQSIIKAITIREEDAMLPHLKGKELDVKTLLIELELAMQAAAEELDFERAIELREKIKEVKEKSLL